MNKAKQKILSTISALITIGYIGIANANQVASEYCSNENKRLPVEYTNQDGTVNFIYKKITCKGNLAKQHIIGKTNAETLDIVALTEEAKTWLLETCKIDSDRIYLDKGMELEADYQVNLSNGIAVNFSLTLNSCGAF